MGFREAEGLKNQTAASKLLGSGSTKIGRTNPAPREICMKIVTLVISTGQLTWLALDEDQAARSRRVEQLIALRGL